ncbi:gentisate 1,2-dioxygenase [Trinickia symbiotica]|uniref:Gentisate 1,2-dioxygenase n=1 Tax=Trinickia symbiotica TaxID=863227 RepID=A0A2T3XKM1_9BURK|nr:cupin domain-containing protein [Trinickia symbiotica]PTB17080.1 gentisate 1,2-dioxygenase [Trinickia symbiotica]
MQLNSTSDHAEIEARRKLQADLERFHCRVHQRDDAPVFTREPKVDMQSVHWRWSDLEPLLQRLGREVALAADGPRRTLRLHNPGLERGTTNTFWASIQVINPGEVATAHRHTANALRFIMRGNGAWTNVDGERYPMNEGDLVLTPAWAFHDHMHEGEEPMIWLDVLDLSIMHMMRATFFEPYPQPEQPTDIVPDAGLRRFGSGLMAPPGIRSAPTNPLLPYSAAMAQRALHEAAGLPPDPFDDVILEYRNPIDGGPTLRTMAQALQLIRPGFEGRARRNTGSKVYYVMRGNGSTTVGDRTFDWRQGDFMAIAPWTWHSHRGGTEESMLFQVNDLPTLVALGYYREEVEAVS